MFIPEFVKRLMPEHQFSDVALPKDSDGESYIQLNGKAVLPLEGSPDRPGFCVMAHVADESNNRPLDVQLESIFNEGFVAPPAYSNWATLPLDWADQLEPPAALIVARTPYRSTREKTYGRGFMEAMIGVSHEQACQVVPTGYRYWTERLLPPRTVGKPIFRYVPPSHLLGCVMFDTTAQRENYFATGIAAVREYKTGKISEAGVLEKTLEESRGLKIERAGEPLSDRESAEMMLAVAAMYTEDALLEIVALCLNKHVAISALESIKPDFPWSQKVLQGALEEAGKKK